MICGDSGMIVRRAIVSNKIAQIAMFALSHFLGRVDFGLDLLKPLGRLRNYRLSRHRDLVACYFINDAETAFAKFFSIFLELEISFDLFFNVVPVHVVNLART